MACEHIQLLPSTKRPLFTKSEAFAAIGGFAVGWLWSRSVGVALALALVGMLIGAYVSSVKISKALYKEANEDLARRGHNTDFQIGSALIDSKAKTIAFVDLAAKTYDLYRTHDILDWEHQWINKTDLATNVWGNNIRGKTRQDSNVLVIKTSNPAKPLYKISLDSHSSGEEWIARLSAIFNG